jgi:hypothetical protein
MKELHNVEPFKYTYRVLDRTIMHWWGDFDSIEEVFKYFGRWTGYYSDGYLGKRFISYDVNGLCYYFNYNKPENKGEYAILRVEDAYVFTHKDIEQEVINFPYKSRRHKIDTNHNRSKDLIFKKNNIAKIKKHYSSYWVSPGASRWWRNHEGYWRSCKYMRSCRIVGTMNEIRQFKGIQADYRGEYNLVRGGRSGLFIGYDRERPIGAYDLADSWKHHSKRRKQWIPKL